MQLVRDVLVMDSIVRTIPIDWWTEAAVYWRKRRPGRRYVLNCRRSASNMCRSLLAICTPCCEDKPEIQHCIPIFSHHSSHICRL